MSSVAWCSSLLISLDGIHQLLRIGIIKQEGETLDALCVSRRPAGFFPRQVSSNRLTLWPARRVVLRTSRRRSAADDRYLGHGRVFVERFNSVPGRRNPRHEFLW